MGKIKRKIEIFNECVKAFGLVIGMKVFCYISIQKKEQKVFSIVNKRTGKDKLFLRNCSSDINLASILLCKNGEYDFLRDDSFYNDIVKRATTVIDVGANIGIFSRVIKTINPLTKIIAIELENSNYNMLNKNLRELANTTCMQKGLWNKDAWLDIIKRETGEVGFVAKEVTKEEALIEAISMSTILSDYKLEKVDILKIDIEGSEYEVFDDNSEEWIEKVSCYIIEMHDKIKPGCTDQVKNRLEKHGFKYQIIGENWIFYK